MKRCATFLAGTLLFAAMAAGQGDAPAFEVASVKVHEMPPGMTGLQVGGPSALTISGNRVTTMGTLGMLVMAAYHLRLHQVSGEPAWNDGGNPLVFDIQAKAEGDGVLSQERARQMLQTLLGERFHLVVRHEVKEMPVYDLTVDKNGPKLKASAPDTPVNVTRSISKGVWIFHYTNLSMSDLVARVAANFDRPLLDKTGIEGSYDFTLAYRRNLDGSGPGPAAASRPDADTGPTIFAALGQLGLKLIPARERIEITVIDHAEKPAAN